MSYTGQHRPLPRHTGAASPAATPPEPDLPEPTDEDGERPPTDVGEHLDPATAAQRSAQP